MDNLLYSAFDGHRRIAMGTLASVATAVHAASSSADRPLQLFRHRDGATIDIDTRGSVAETLERLGIGTAPRGRPRLGVVAREVTLLPRHWDWLAAQPGGASVALRRLIDAARRDDAGNRRATRDATYRFMSAIAGDMPGFEAATRALFAGDDALFATLIADWPTDIVATLIEISAGTA
jgi:uncharacterized protein